MRSAVFVVPGPLDTRTGGSIYDRRMVDGLRQRGWSIDVVELDETFPCPTPSALHHAARALNALGTGAVVIVDGLALGAMPDIIEAEAPRLRLAAIIHLPLAAEASLDRETADRREAAERRALAAVSIVIVTGTAALPLLAPYCLGPERLVVVEPGTDRAPLARGGPGIPLRLLSVANLTPGKGHESLLSALAEVPHRNWHLTCAGSLTRHPATAERVKSVARALRLEDRVSLVGDLDRSALAECYHHADVFVLATRQETYGMAVAEALACGLPVISTITGAIPDLVGDDAGILVPPGHIPALAAALSRVIGDAALRRRLAEGARRVRQRLRSWEDATCKLAAALESLDAHG